MGNACIKPTWLWWNRRRGMWVLCGPCQQVVIMPVQDDNDQLRRFAAHPNCPPTVPTQLSRLHASFSGCHVQVLHMVLTARFHDINHHDARVTMAWYIHLGSDIWFLTSQLNYRRNHDKFTITSMCKHSARALAAV